MSQSVNTSTADLDTADSEGVQAGSVAMYQWFTAIDAGANKNNIGTASATNMLDTSIAGNKLVSGAVYGVIVTYTDGLGSAESVDARQSTIAFTSHDSYSFSSAHCANLTSVSADQEVVAFATSIIGSGTASYAITGEANKDYFTIIADNKLEMLTSAHNFPTTQNSYVVAITAADSASMDTAVQTFTANLESVSPAQIPDRQALARDPYDSDEDPNG